MLDVKKYSGLCKSVCITSHSAHQEVMCHNDMLYPSSYHIRCNFLVAADNWHEGGHDLTAYQCHVWTLRHLRQCLMGYMAQVVQCYTTLIYRTIMLPTLPAHANRWDVLSKVLTLKGFGAIALTVTLEAHRILGHTHIHRR